MRGFVTDGIVIGARRFGEADRILALLTPDHGRIGVIAKSARKSTSSFQGAAEPFVTGQFELAEGRNLCVLRHAQVTNAHLGIRQRWSRLQLAGHVAEIANKMGIEKHPDPELYDLTVRAMDEIDQGRIDAVLRFKVGLLDHLGVFPELGGCVECGATRVKGSVHLDDKSGGFLCEDCAKFRGIFDPVPMAILHIMNDFRMEKEIAGDVDPVLLDLAEDIMTNLLQSFLQAGFKTVPAERQARIAERAFSSSAPRLIEGEAEP